MEKEKNKDCGRYDSKFRETKKDAQEFKSEFIYVIKN